MRYFLSPRCLLKRLEIPAVYSIPRDELYELDEPAFAFLRTCAGTEGCDDAGCDREFIEYALSEGILTEEYHAGKRPSIREAGSPSLRYLELQITRRCNLRCRHCYLGPPEDVELSVPAIKRIFAEFEEMQGLRLLITGGEPLLYREFPALNELLPGYAFRKVLFTNGLLLGEETMGSLAVDEIQVSIDGLEAGHDALRGKGTYRKAIGAVELALARDFQVSVSTMVHAANLDEFEGLEALLKGMGIKDWTVDIPCGEGNLKVDRMLQPGPEIAGQYLRYGFGAGLHGGGEGFACGLHLASVTADGKVAKCTFYSHRPAGTIDEGLEACWRKIVPLGLGELSCDCDARNLCRGGCRYRAELLGDPLGKDYYRCAAFNV